jgi:hypothetical protein
MERREAARERTLCVKDEWEVCIHAAGQRVLSRMTFGRARVHAGRRMVNGAGKLIACKFEFDVYLGHYHAYGDVCV